MDNYILERTNSAPVSFTGEQLCQPVEICVEQRCYSGVAYYTKDMLVVLSIVFRSEWEWEHPYNWVFVGKNPYEIFGIQREIKSCVKIPPDVGFPPSDHSAEKQLRLHSELQLAFYRLILRVYTDSGIVDEI